MADPAARPGTPEHAEFEALAAGYALHALEPEDEQLLSAHLLSCRTCARLVADTASLGAAFADLIEPESPPPGLRARVLAAAAQEPRPIPEPPVTAAPAAPPVAAPPAQRGGRRLRERFAVAALAAAVGVGVAVPVTLAAAHRSSPASSAALAQWLLQPHAREVTLTASKGTGRAKAVITDRGVYLLAAGLPVNDRSRSVYVLWAATSAGQPRPVATFDVRGGADVQLAADTLPYPQAQIHQLAVSYEQGRTAPAQPTDILLRGSAA